MCSPLVFIALELNQTITDKIYHVGPNIYWNSEFKLFVAEKRLFPHLFHWKFVNLGIVVFIGLFGCIFVLSDALFNPKAYELFPLFAVAIQFLFGVAMSGGCLIWSSLVNDLVLMLNELLSFSNKLNRIEAFENHPSEKRFVHKILNDLIICFQNKQLDLMGIISIALVLSFAAIPFILPPIALYMNIDVTFFIFNCVWPRHSRSIYLSITVFTLRSTIVILCITEGCATFRNLSLILIYKFSLCRKCVQCFFKGNIPCINGYRALRILFIIANQFCSLILSLYFGMIFYLIIICATISVVAVNKVPWTLYVFFPVIGAISFIIVAILFYLTVFMADDCTKLINKWIWFCGTNFSQPGNRFKLKIFYKTWLSIQKIAFSYGSWGTITKATRTDYFGSLVSYSANAILTCRDSM